MRKNSNYLHDIIKILPNKCIERDFTRRYFVALGKTPHDSVMSDAMNLDEYTKYDISNLNYDEFIDFLFDKSVVPMPEDVMKGPVPWYLEAAVLFNPSKVASFYVKLFTEPRFLLDRFTDEQIEQGFWAIQCHNIECSVSEVIWLPEVQKELRENCVLSMYYLFEKLFSIKSLDTSVNMWWDSLAYDWHCDVRNRNNGGEDLWMQDVMFETLKQILFLPNLECQISAIHGLGHLHHPNTVQIIEKYLQQNIGLEDDVREYALAASVFDIM